MKKLQNGSKGSDVKSLQKALNTSKIKARLKVDGKFGVKTEDAVRKWQKHSRLKVTGVVDKTTLASLGLGGNKSRRSRQGYPFVAPDSIVIDAKKRRSEGRARMQKVMRLAAKSKVPKMSYRQKLMPKVWKTAEARWREVETPTIALVFAEGVFISADGPDPRTKSKLLKDGKANLARALRALKSYNKAMDEVERIMGDMEQIAQDEVLYTPILLTARSLLREMKKWRKDQQDSVLQKMKVCNTYGRPEFEAVRRRYLQIESLLDKSFKAVWTHQEILANQEDMYNKYIKSKPRQSLIELKKRMERQKRKVDSVVASWDAISRQKHDLDEELSALARAAA